MAVATFALVLLVEFERLPRGVSPNIEHYEVIGLPKNFLASKNRATTKRWWIIHNHTSETGAPSLEG